MISGVLKNGEVVCIFLEGKLICNGEMNIFCFGIEWIIECDIVLVVLMVLIGLWGFFFSYEGKGVFKVGNGCWWLCVGFEVSVLVVVEDVLVELL